MKRLGYDSGFDVALDYYAALEEVSLAPKGIERGRWEREAQRLSNKITPAARQAAAPVHSAIKNEGLRWYRRHGGINYSAFIRHCRSIKIDQRQRRGADRATPLTDSAIRKIAAKGLGVRGKNGRPPSP